MIRIVINGRELDTAPGMQLERSFETTIFNRNTEAADFVYPVDLPLTDNNKIALYHPDIISKHIHFQSFDCELIIDGIYSKCLLYVESVNLDAQTIRISITGDYGGFWKDAAGKMVHELSLGGVRTVGSIDVANEGMEFLDPLTEKCILLYTPCTTGTHIQGVMNGSIETDYLFYTAVDEKINLPRIHEKQRFDDMTQDGALPNVRSIINPYFYNDGSDFGVIDPVKAYIETTFHDDFLKTHDRYFWVPFFRLSYVIKQCFIELGYAVVTDILDDADFKAITLYNTYSINRCTRTQEVIGVSGQGFAIHVQHHATQIDGRNHVPKMYIADFLREVAKNFNLQYRINYSTREVFINCVGDISPNINRIVDITDKVTPKPTIVYEKTAKNNGYSFRFEADDTDGAIFENVIEGIGGLNDVGTLQDTGEFGLIISPDELDIVFVVSERAWYQYIGGGWHFFGYNKPEYKPVTGEDTEEIVSKVVPIPSKRFSQLGRMEFPNKPVMQAPHNFTYDHDHLLPYSKLGIEGRGLLGIQRWPFASIGGAAKDVYEHAFTLHYVTFGPYQPHLCNYLGFAYPKADSVVESHPCGSSSNRDAQGVARAGYGLHWYGNDNQDNLYDRFWKNYVNQVKDSVVAEYEMLWDAATYLGIDLQTNFLNINNILYLCDKANIVFPFPSTGKLRLVKW